MQDVNSTGSNGLSQEALTALNFVRGAHANEGAAKELLEVGMDYMTAAAVLLNKDVPTLLKEQVTELKPNASSAPLFSNSNGDVSRYGKGDKVSGWLKKEVESGRRASGFFNPERKIDTKTKRDQWEHEIKDGQLTLGNAVEGEEKEFVTKYLADNS